MGLLQLSLNVLISNLNVFMLVSDMVNIKRYNQEARALWGTGTLLFTYLITGFVFKIIPVVAQTDFSPSFFF